VAAAAAGGRQQGSHYANNSPRREWDKAAEAPPQSITYVLFVLLTAARACEDMAKSKKDP